MKRALILGFFAFGAIAMTGCENGAATDGGGESHADTTHTVAPEANTQDAPTQFEGGGLKIYSLENSTAYPNSKLKMTNPPSGVDLAGGNNKFEFETTDYELGAQTPDASENGLANSGKGQHLHFILNNGPYSAKYEGAFEQELEDGHYVMLAFLSRSYHMSVKSPDAYVLKQFVAGQPSGFKEANLKAPHMFYSRPKGTYKGDDTKKIMLDFYLVNCDLAADGYKVKANINGNDFTFAKWVPYVIEGLPMGENKISLELIDAEGQTVASPFNPVERTFMLEEGA